jgi:WD40 repeat protein
MDRKAVRATLGGHTERITALAYSPDGLMLAAASGDGTIRLWETLRDRSFGSLHVDIGYGVDLSFAPDKRTLACVTSEGVMLFWDARTGKRLQIWKSRGGPELLARFAARRLLLATATGDRKIKLWQWDESRLTPLALFADTGEGITSLAVSPDDRYVATGSEKGTVKVWRVDRLLDHKPGAD